jgi:PAS domain S-box-containing protein
LSDESRIDVAGDGGPVLSQDGRPHPGTILAIDDDEVTLGILRELLELNGYDVLTAGEGRAGIGLFEKDRPNLVITDIRMPHVDGLEVLRRVRELDDTVPVILVTGFGDLENAIRALRRGAYDFLQKPINAEILLKIVRQGLEHSRLKRFAKNYTRVLEEQVEERTRELAEANDFLKGILDSSTGVSIVLTDFDQNILFWNKGAEKIFGYTSDEMVGSKISKLYPPGSSSTDGLGELRRLVRTKLTTVGGKIRQLAKDGRELTISLTLSPMMDTTGNVAGLLGLGQDVTEEARLHEELVDSYSRIQRIQKSSMFALAKLAESRDGETGNHLRRIQEYCLVLCRRLRVRKKYENVVTDQFIDFLVQSAILHDVGKVAIPDSILFNPGRFGVDDFEIMKRHTVHGGRALDEAARETGEESFLSFGRDVAYYHHERWDGKGYPFGLQGEEIPLTARIVAIADVFDALTTRRRYKRAYTHEEAFAVLAAERGKQFDPDLVDAFMEVEEEFRKIRERDSDTAGSLRPGRADAPTESADQIA